MGLYLERDSAKNDGIKISLIMLCIKFLYIYIIDLMLPDDYMLWSFHKNVNYYYVWIEIIPFIITSIIVSKDYRSNSFVSFFVIVLFVLGFIPANSQLTLSSCDLTFYCLNSIYFLVLFLALGKLSKNEDKIETFKTFNSNGLFGNPKAIRAVRIGSIFISFLTIGYVYLYNGLNIMSVLAASMYDVRADAAEFYQEHTNGLVAYLIMIIRRLDAWFAPIYMYFAFKRKNVFDIFLSLFAMFAVFSTSMEKSTLFVIAIVFFSLYVEKFRKGFDGVGYIFLTGMIILSFVSILEYNIYNESLVFSMVLRRILYVPAYMIEVTCSFYAEHTKIWFTHDCLFVQNIMQQLISTPYTGASVETISMECFDGLLPAPNSGLFAEAFAQLGCWGILIFPFITTYIVKVMLKYSKWYGNGVAVIILVKLYLHTSSIFILASTYLVGLVLFVIITRFFINLSK